MAEETEHERLDELSSYGNIGAEPLVCHYIEKHASKGIFFGDNPLHHGTSMLIIQIILIFIVCRMTHLLLKLCHQTQLISHIVAGIILGPLLLGQNYSTYELLFPEASKLTLVTFAEFGIVIYFFKVGVQINPKHIFKFEKKTTIIGLAGHISTIVFGIIVFIIVERGSYLKSEAGSVIRLVILEALSAFSAISSLLNEINMLNSEIGRVALSAAMVSDASSWILFFSVANTIKNLRQSSFIPVVAFLTTVAYFVSLFFLLRPLVIWISNRNPRGKPMTEGNFLSIMFILLFIGFSSQSVGQPAFIVAFWFGLILPDGPPLGSALVERIDTIGSTLIVPAFCTIVGMSTIVPPLSSQAVCIEVVFLAGYIGKFAGTILPSLYFEIDLWDSVALSLVMCCKGLIDLSLYTLLFTDKDIEKLSFTLAVYTMVGVTGFSSIGIHYLYDPSRMYKNNNRKSIKDSQKDLELKVLVCVHNEENVFPLINLLQASNPSKATPFSVFVLHLMELSGRAAPILTKNDKLHDPNDGDSSSTSQQINNVFYQFQQHNKGSVTLECFTTIAPFASMHDDICYIAMQTKCHIVIMPFHKQWSINGHVEASNASIRTLNQKVLSKSPCSVGVLIDRSHNMSGKLLVISQDKPFNEIAMIFLGGADDQDALAFSFQMAQHPNIRLTVFWIRVKMHYIQRNMKNPYIDVMEHIKHNPSLQGKVNFKEEIVEDGIGTTHIVRTMEEQFSLVIVGRHHMTNSGCTLGLSEWCELPELGPIGNLLASDFTFSVLVVQQQPFNLDIQCIR